MTKGTTRQLSCAVGIYPPAVQTNSGKTGGIDARVIVPASITSEEDVMCGGMWQDMVDRASDNRLCRRHAQMRNSRGSLRTSVRAVLALCTVGAVIAIPCAEASTLQHSSAQLARVTNLADRQELTLLVSSSAGRDAKVRT